MELAVFLIPTLPSNTAAQTIVDIRSQNETHIFIHHLLLLYNCFNCFSYPDPWEDCRISKNEVSERQGIIIDRSAVCCRADILTDIHIYFISVFGQQEDGHTNIRGPCKVHTNPQTQTLIRLLFPFTLNISCCFQRQMSMLKGTTECFILNDAVLITITAALVFSNV